MPAPRIPETAPPATHTVAVTTTTLEQLSPTDLRPSRPMPANVRVDLAAGAGPEFVRWLYATVGGPWRWTDRLGWTRSRWAAELAEAGSEVWVAYARGVPAGYLQLGAAARPEHRGTACEIRYFGLQEWAIGRGIGGPLLTHGIARAWDLAERHDLPAVTRVWVHTCSLDGPAALSNYRSRGLRVIGEEYTEKVVPAVAAGAWLAMGGPPDTDTDTGAAPERSDGAPA